MIAVRCDQRPGSQRPDDGNRVPVSRAHPLALSHSSRVMRQVQSMPCSVLTLGVFEVGLSWSIVFGKRDAFRRAFYGFDIAKVAAMTRRDVDRLLQGPVDHP